jgi:phosphate/phosphite/phosphonate ABC transporter binding protein
MVTSSTKHEQRTLVFATSPGIRWDLAQLDTAAAQLQKYLSDLMDMPVQVILGENYEDVLAGLEQGSIDVAKLGPYAFALAQARFGARALVNAVDANPNGARPHPYRSVIFTRSDSGITHLAQLKHRRFGFVDRHSTTGYLMATFLLEQAGLNPSLEVVPVFLHSHQAVADAVIRGEVAAGAVMEEEFARSTEEVDPTALRLLTISPLLSRGPIVVRSELPRAIERKLLQVLEHIHKADLDYLQLLKLPTQRFVPTSPRARTLKTVAELAGVSYATVSRAINGRDRISPTTTARILQLVEELGYRPNANARSLHQSKGDFVGLLLPSLNYPGLDDIIAGMQAVFDDVYMKILICPVGPVGSEEAQQRQKTYFEMFSNSRFEGVLLTQWSALDSAALESLVRGGRPYVLLEQDLVAEGLRTAWSWLREQGHQHIALVTTTTALLEPGTTLRACEQLAQAPVLHIDSPTDTLDWQNILQSGKATPSALLCTDKNTALHIHRTLQRLNPDLLLMGIGTRAHLCHTTIPMLTFDGHALGQVAALRLLKMLNLSTLPIHTSIEFWIQTPDISPTFHSAASAECS